MIALIAMIAHLQLAQGVDPRGPIESVVQGQTPSAKVSPGRVEARNLTFDPKKLPGLPTHLQWITASDKEKPVCTLFRKEIDLFAAPSASRVWFSADAHVRIYVNGRLVARGPDDGGQDYPGQQTGKWFVNYRDLTPFFHQGRNAIAAEVFTAQAMEGRYNTAGKVGFLFKAEIQMPNGREETAESDQTWRAIPSRAWKFAEWSSNGNKVDRALQLDAEEEPRNWRLVGFDDSNWPHCVAAGQWPTLVLSEIPPRLEATYPIGELTRPSGDVSFHGNRITFNGQGTCTARYDRVLSAFVGLKLRGAAGTLLAIELNEPNRPGHNRMATVRLRDGEQAFELPFYDGFSVINLSATNVTKPLEIEDVRANFVAQPVAYRGEFSCSDENLNRIWQTCRWLTQICQQTHHLDSPDHQEPICDPGDYLIISANNAYAFGQPWLARQDLRKYAWLLEATKFRPFHTSYALLWLQMLVQYELYTGDSDLVKELAPTVHRLLDQFAGYIGKNGIISEAPDYMFMDWVTIAGFGTHHPPAVIGQGYMTAFFYRALADGIHVANLSGGTKRAEKYEKLRKGIKEAFNRELWDEKAGLYRDGKPFVTSVKPSEWLPADTNIECHSTQNNALAVLYDLAPPERQAPIMRRLLKEDLNVQPYFMHFVFSALDHAGLFDEFGTGQMRRLKVVPETQSFREMWDSGDYSHAWQCTPMFQMSARVLGVTPTSPGFRTMEIRPHLCDLRWAKGVVPTQHGNVDVSWTRSDAVFQMEVRIPDGCSAKVVLPSIPGHGQATLDDRPLPKEAEVGAGRHRLVLR